MKKLFVITFAAMAVFAFISCQTEDNGGTGGNGKTLVTITFEAGSGVTGVTMPAPIKIDKGTSLGDQLPAGPDRGSGWSFDAWYIDLADPATKVEETTTFNEDTSIYALWKAVIVDAVAPAIVSANQPQGAHYIENGGVLTVAGTETTGMVALAVTATVTDGGVLSYEWFKVADAGTATDGTLVDSGDGTVSADGAKSTFMPSTTARGTYYFYAVATNTNSIAIGNKTATRRSNTVTIRITGPVSTPPAVTIGGVTINSNVSTPEKGKYGTAHTGSLTFTSMGYVVLKDTDYANLSVSFGAFSNTDDSIKVQKITLPNTRVTGAAVAANWESASDTLSGAAFTARDVIQIQHTRAVPPGTTGVAAAEVAYYTIYIRRAIEIPYLANAASTLGLVNADGNAASIPYEAEWDNAVSLLVDRPYMADTPSLNGSKYDPNNPPVLKLLWSDDGLYFYMYIVDDTVVLEGAGDHLVDNLELFISEDFTWTATGDWATSGGQYRVDRNGVRSGNTTERVTKMVNSDAAGYTIMGRVGWAAPSTTPANDKMIGFDAQLALCSAPGTRDACICWNSFLSGSYQNKTNAGVLFLKGKP